MISTWDTASLETTRGRIVAILRHGQKTVNELSEALSLATNTIRTHLNNLEGDSVVQKVGSRRGSGAGKPAHLFELTPQTETSFSRAYIPVLQTLVETLAQQMEKDAFNTLMDDVGLRLAPPAVADRATADQRLAVARTTLEDLGATVTSARANGSVFVEGAGCPLSAVVAKHPQLCRTVRSLLSAALGVEVQALCDHGDRPACRFESS